MGVIGTDGSCTPAAASRSDHRDHDHRRFAPDAIRMRLGRTLRQPAPAAALPAGWTRIAIRGMATGLLLGLVAGTAVTPSIAGVLVTGGATLAYALVTFGTESLGGAGIVGSPQRRRPSALVMDRGRCDRR
jgi:hypothetical protein